MKIVEPSELKSWEGKELGASDWFEIDQDRINAFADATLDHQFIHVDPEKAKATPFGSTIAHGYLTVSLLPYLQTSIADFLLPKGMKMGMNYGSVSVDPMKGQPQIRNISFINTSATQTCAVGALVGATADSISGVHFDGCDFHTTVAKPWLLTNVSTSTCTSHATTPAFPTGE